MPYLLVVAPLRVYDVCGARSPESHPLLIQWSSCACNFNGPTGTDMGFFGKKKCLFLLCILEAYLQSYIEGYIVLLCTCICQFCSVKMPFVWTCIDVISSIQITAVDIRL